MEKAIFEPGRFTILDGAMGTMLQHAGLKAGARPEELVFSQPELLTSVHRAYVEAGADIIATNTFGANSKKLAGSGLTLQAVVTAAVKCARNACAGTNARVALDVGPLGELLEPAGTLSFEDAYALFAEIVTAGEAAGADLILFETMTDLYECRAGLLAAREHTSLPVMISMTFEENGRTFAGVPVEAMAASLAPLGASALGINCSLGPAAIVPMAQRLCNASPLPVFIKPNAGLPDPLTGQHMLEPAGFCEEMQPYLTMGVSAVGGCCGTTPETIKLLVQKFKNQVPSASPYIPHSVLCSGTNALQVTGICPVGERINPTGKKRLQAALADGDVAYIQSLAVAQESAGAALLDVNVGAPGVDEVTLLPLAVKSVQAVSGLPLTLDSSNPKALAAALRVYNGKPLVNSTSGEEEKLHTILPLCKQYGAAVVGLTLDEHGIPESAEERLAIAEKILRTALQYGIPKEDVYIDCLTLAASAGEQGPAETLRAVSLVKQKLGLKTLLGVSNVSFGLPNRPLANETFLNLAFYCGLDLPILNPASQGMMDTVAAFEMLTGADEGARHYVSRFAAEGAKPIAPSPSGGSIPLDVAIEAGLKSEAGAGARALLTAGNTEAMDIVNNYLMPALDTIGRGFEAGTVFLPQLLAAAGAAQAAFEEIRAYYGSSAPQGEPIVIATVHGDVHDIGKNIVKVLLENYGYRVIDLGRDVPPDRVVQATKESGARLVGLSALMTTTLPAMEATIAALHAKNLPCRVMVGGAVLTEEYALKIGADYYAKDAKRSVDIAKEVLGSAQ
ncbi:MAG: homocysteine S-methyltransferase family protein [Oscillospiraceae bacterium]